MKIIIQIIILTSFCVWVSTAHAQGLCGENNIIVNREKHDNTSTSPAYDNAFWDYTCADGRHFTLKSEVEFK